jgi:TRAP-type C4-dicarboxylate transport system substrate-binding protein
MPPIVMKFGGYQKPASIHNRAAGDFGAALKRKFGDAIEFQLIGDVLSLGRKSGDLPHMVASGELSFCYISSVRFTDVAPEIGVIELPFVVKNRAAIKAAFAGEFGAMVKAGIERAGKVRVMGFWDNGFRHLTNRVRPIHTPADCQGLRIRTQISDLHVEVFRAMGFEPIPVDVKEFVEQVGTDRFQAQDNPLTNTYNFGVHKYHRYITLSGHLFGGTVMLCNEEHYRSWPADVRSAVDEAAREATELQWQYAAAEDSDILAKLDPRENEVIDPSPTERAAFVAAVQPVLEKHRKTFDPKLFSYLG